MKFKPGEFMELITEGKVNHIIKANLNPRQIKAVFKEEDGMDKDLANYLTGLVIAAGECNRVEGEND